MPKIYILGLGAGSLGQMTLDVFRLLTTATPLYLRTREHPVVKELEQQGIDYTSFDSVYEQYSSFTEVYQAIVSSLEEHIKQQKTIYYAVPGHPLVAERTVQMLLERAQTQGFQVEIVGGQSFLDPLFVRLAIDPVEGFQLLDGTALAAHHLHPAKHTVITQVYDTQIASEVKLTLMEVYPDDYLITVATAIGIPGQESITRIPLFELDRQRKLGNLTCVYIPITTEEKIINRQYYQAREIIRVLRGPEGCPWDKEQTHHSLKKYLQEETEEVLAAIDAEDPDHLTEELGDLLLQVFLHAQIAEEEGYFNMEDILQALTEKMIRRHPHVFGDSQAKTVAEVSGIWEEIKQQEQQQKNTK